MPMEILVGNDSDGEQPENPEPENIEEEIGSDFETWTLLQCVAILRRNPKHVQANYRAGCLYKEKGNTKATIK